MTDGETKLNAEVLGVTAPTPLFIVAEAALPLAQLSLALPPTATKVGEAVKYAPGVVVAAPRR